MLHPLEELRYAATRDGFGFAAKENFGPKDPRGLYPNIRFQQVPEAQALKHVFVASRRPDAS